MERTEFLRGWILLTTQPWGKAYRSTTQTQTSGEPNPAEIQAELYYKSLQYSYPPAWVEVCECLAQGDHWPSISECKETLKHTKAQPPQRKALAAPDGGPFLTKEEFGLDLYECIKLFAGRHQIRAYIRRLEKKEEDEPLTERERFTLTGHRTKDKELTEQITVLMPKLSATDQRRLLDRYESQGAA